MKRGQWKEKMDRDSYFLSLKSCSQVNCSHTVPWNPITKHLCDSDGLFLTMASSKMMLTGNFRNKEINIRHRENMYSTCNQETDTQSLEERRLQGNSLQAGKKTKVPWKWEFGVGTYTEHVLSLEDAKLIKCYFSLHDLMSKWWETCRSRNLHKVQSD